MVLSVTQARAGVHPTAELLSWGEHGERATPFIEMFTGAVENHTKTGQDGGQRDQIRSLSTFTKRPSNPITRAGGAGGQWPADGQAEALGHRAVQTVP